MCWHVGTQTNLAHMACVVHDWANSHMLCESVNMTTVKISIEVYDITTLHYLMIKEKFE